MDIFTKIRIAEETKLNTSRWKSSIAASILSFDKSITVEQICMSREFLNNYIGSIMNRLEPELHLEISDTIYRANDFPEQMQDLFNEMNAHIGSVIRAFEGGDDKCM